jgi:flagellar basal-body rod protein FlgB
MPNAPDILNRLEAGLRGANLRQALIANNLANLDTPGYRRADTNFEKTLADAIESGKPVNFGRDEDSILTPLTTPVAANGNDVDIDMEVGEMVKNSSVTKTYLRLVSRTYRLMDMAMKDSL